MTGIAASRELQTDHREPLDKDFGFYHIAKIINQLYPDTLTGEMGEDVIGGGTSKKFLAVGKKYHRLAEISSVLWQEDSIEVTVSERTWREDNDDYSYNRETIIITYQELLPFIKKDEYKMLLMRMTKEVPNIVARLTSKSIEEVGKWYQQTFDAFYLERYNTKAY